MKKVLAVTVLAMFFTLALAAPAFAFEHTATYRWEGTIDFSSTAGHYCNTGAQMEQRISGQGSMYKTKDVYMEEGKIAVTDNNDWVTAPDAIRNLTVTTAIKLCAPAKYTYDPNGGATASSDVAWPYNDNGGLAVVDNSPNWYALTNQVWAVQVSADPGHSGQIEMAFEAANSNEINSSDSGKAWNSAWFEDAGIGAWPGKENLEVGPWFPGSYFNIEQFSRTSQGTHRRFIDISSPWSHGYLKEDMTVVGMSEVYEAFSMENVPAGSETDIDWWNLF